MIIKVSDISASYAKYTIQQFNSDIHLNMAKQQKSEYSLQHHC